MARLSECILEPDNQTDNPVVARVLEKQELLKANDPAHEEIRTALVIGSGGMRGVYSGGVVTGLEELDMTDVFDNVIGISAGAATAAYFLAGDARRGTTIYHDELASKDFIDLRRLRSGVMSVEFMGQVFREGKVLDQSAIRKNRSHLHVGVTERSSGTPHYIDVSSQDDLDITRLIEVSCSVPGVTKLPAPIGEKAYSDGMTGCTTPIRHAIESLGATDIIMILNEPLRETPEVPSLERWLSRILLREFSREFRQAHLNRRVENDQQSYMTYDDSVNIGIIAPEELKLSRLSTNSQQMIRIARQATRQTLTIFKSV